MLNSTLTERDNVLFEEQLHHNDIHFIAADLEELHQISRGWLLQEHYSDYPN